MASPSLSHSQIDEIIRHENVDEWLELWLESQGGSTHNRRLELMAASIPFPGNEEIAVLDVCCGPGDVGRFIRRRFGVARVDLVDRDPLLLALGRELKRRAGIPGQTFVRDLWEPGWLEGLGAGYHVIGAATALHWFDVARLGELFADFFRLLRPRGVLVFAEPVGAAPPFATGFEEWRASEPSTYDLRTWDRFWSRANTLLAAT